MLTTAAALDAIRAALRHAEYENVSLDRACGRVLQQSIVAERDQPPFDRVTMDGIAFCHRDLADTARLPIQGTQHAGDPVLALDDGKCIEIMTGASLPMGADCIVPVERILVDDGIAGIEEGYDTEVGQFIHRRGSDHAAGTELLQPGRRITPADVAVIASAGVATLAVSRIPVIRVISTGNELVPAEQDTIEDHQIRLSNGPAIVSMLQEDGYNDCEHDHIVDDADVLRERIGQHIDQADVLVLSGGVSMGKADFVPSVLEDLGVDVVFHKISQRPGKPMWFGTGPDQQLVFALPGNPVSALVCCRQYVIPALKTASGEADGRIEFAALTQDVEFKPDLTCFLPVRLVSNAAGQTLAMPVHTNTSGDFTALSGTDGYVELDREQQHFATGTVVRLHRWRLT